MSADFSTRVAAAAGSQHMEQGLGLRSMGTSYKHRMNRMLDYNGVQKKIEGFQ